MLLNKKKNALAGECQSAFQWIVSATSIKPYLIAVGRQNPVSEPTHLAGRSHYTAFTFSTASVSAMMLA